MPPETPPEPQLGAAELTRAPLAALAARQEEAAQKSPRPRCRSRWTTDDELVALWLHGKSPNTIRAYGADIAAFRACTGKSLRATYLSDLATVRDTLGHESIATTSRYLHARPEKSSGDYLAL